MKVAFYQFEYLFQLWESISRRHTHTKHYAGAFDSDTLTMLKSKSLKDDDFQIYHYFNKNLSKFNELSDKKSSIRLNFLTFDLM